MADLKISALSAGGAAQSTDKIPAARGGANVSLSPAALAAAGLAVRKTANYTAVSGDDIMADTSGGSFAIKVPDGGTEGMRFKFCDAARSFAAYPLTIDRNGQTIMGRTEDMLVDTVGASSELKHNGTTWVLA